ncbi:TPA: DnaJ domain-containing protein, partial [Citrobacter freundii]|nr:DnaJ domain-containing protein [Citrobacter freundii]
MTIQEALNIFGLSGQLTKEDIKKAYRKASLKHHPDRNKDNPIAAEIMKAICSVSPLRDAIGIARDIKRKILCNAREQISFYEADTKGERLLREEREYTINLLSRLV